MQECERNVSCVGRSHDHACCFVMTRKLVGGAAFVLAVVAIGWSAGHQWREIVTRLEQLDILFSAAAALAGTAMLAFSAFGLGFLAHPGSIHFAVVWRVARIYLIAQPLKYLPGRIWALAYQVAKIGEQAGNRMAVAASLSQLALSTVGSLVVFGIASGAQPLLLPAALFVAAVWLWRGGVARYLGIAGVEWMSIGQTLRVLGSVACEWATFALATWLTCRALASGDEFSFSLVALYSIAWIVGSLAAITPGGLVIREGGFVALCQINGIPGEFAGMFALVARLVFTISEIAAVGLCLCAGRGRLVRGVS